MNALRTSFLFLSLALSAAPASADDSPRAGRVMWLSGDAPGVWITPRRIWAPAAQEPLSACGAGRCLPIVDRASCEVPECPGGGMTFAVAEDLVPVGAFPRDYGGYTQEVERLRADARLSGLGLSSHPEESARAEQRRREEEARRREEQRHREPVRWVSAHRERDRLELSLFGSVATLAEAGGSFAGGTATLSLVFLLDDDESDETDRGDTIMNVFFGDTMGADLRVHFLYRLDAAQEAEWITAVGVAPALGNRYADSAVRLPTFFGTLLPELGMILRADRSPTWYAAWSAPFSFLASHDLAIDLAARVFVVDDWIPKPDVEDADDPVEAIFMLSAGFRLP